MKLSTDNLNFEDTEDYISQRSSYNPHLNYNEESFDDEEEVSLINFNNDILNSEELGF